MKKLIGVLAIGLVSLSLAWAKPLNFEDKNFDYSDDGLETAYVSLAKNAEGGLQIDFTSEEIPTAVATVDVEDQVTGYDTEGDNAYWDEQVYVINPDAATTFEGVDLEYRGLSFQRVTLVHESQNFEEVKAAYMAQLEQLGFTLTSEPQDANVEVYTMESGEDTIRMILNNQGNDTQVTFSVS
jgi:hypothetical protein